MRQVTTAAQAARAAQALRATARELGWVAAHVALYPTGMRADRRLDQPVGADPERTPILLLHGLVDNRSVFTRLRAALARDGFDCLTSMNYPVLTADIATAAEGLAAVVDGIRSRTGYQQIHVVAHSMGGLIARYYVQRLGGDTSVHTLVTLATPHTGTATAKLLPYGVVRQLQPGSEILTDLAGPSPGCGTHIVSIYSDHDALVVPATAGRLTHPDLDVRNVLVPGSGHHTLAFDRRVVREIASALRHQSENNHSCAPKGAPHLQ